MKSEKQSNPSPRRLKTKRRQRRRLRGLQRRQRRRPRRQRLKTKRGQTRRQTRTNNCPDNLDSLEDTAWLQCCKTLDRCDMVKDASQNLSPSLTCSQEADARGLVGNYVATCKYDAKEYPKDSQECPENQPTIRYSMTSQSCSPLFNQAGWPTSVQNVGLSAIHCECQDSQGNTSRKCGYNASYSEYQRSPEDTVVCAAEDTVVCAAGEAEYVRPVEFFSALNHTFAGNNVHNARLQDAGMLLGNSENSHSLDNTHDSGEASMDATSFSEAEAGRTACLVARARYLNSASGRNFGGKFYKEVTAVSQGNRAGNDE